LTYAGNPDNVSDLDKSKHRFYCGNITDYNMVMNILEQERPDTIFNFAAESHVDNSIKDSSPFVTSNVMGTVNLLECVKKQNRKIRFVHVSTDEVYGSLDLEDSPFTETTPYSPRSPYSASKAASDHFVMAYHHTYGLDTVITNCSNNYGPYQHPEKFIPTVIRNALYNAPIPVYGTGNNVRDWIHVDDHCAGILAAAFKGISGEKYNFGGENQVTNLDLAHRIVKIMGADADLITFVKDRLGHDFRYDIDNTKSRKELGWEPKHDFESGLNITINWYMKNKGWIVKCLEKRLGLS
jgi:dTDP-glucose 4,6-dehydratase